MFGDTGTLRIMCTSGGCWPWRNRRAGDRRRRHPVIGAAASSSARAQLCWLGLNDGSNLIAGANLTA